MADVDDDKINGNNPNGQKPTDVDTYKQEPDGYNMAPPRDPRRDGPVPHPGMVLPKKSKKTMTADSLSLLGAGQGYNSSNI